MTATDRAGDRIRVEREARGWGLRDLGSAAELDFGYVGKIERGAAAASLPVYERIASALGLNLDALFGTHAREGSVASPEKRKAPRRAVRRRSRRIA